MSAAAHTTGSWEVANIEFGNTVTEDLCIMTGSPDFRAIATIARCFQGDRIKDMEQANARLIALAPDLLALLVESQSSIGGDWRERRDAAIAKATGAA